MSTALDRVEAESLASIDDVPSLVHNSCTDEDVVRSQTLDSKLDRALQKEEFWEKLVMVKGHYLKSSFRFVS